jgi:hypothetical protein
MTEPRQFGRTTPERQWEIDCRVQTQSQIDENRRLRAEHWDRNEHQMHCYQVVRELIFDLKVDLGRMATAEEKNGNYKTADSLTAIRIRLSEQFDVASVAGLARERAGR